MILIGFDLATMAAAKLALPSFPSVFIVAQRDEAEALAAVAAAAAAGLDGVDFAADANSVTQAAVAAAHAQGLFVAVWVWPRM